MVSFLEAHLRLLSFPFCESCFFPRNKVSIDHREEKATLPKANISPEKWWLEDVFFFLGGAQPIFRGKLFVFKGGYKCSEMAPMARFFGGNIWKKNPGSILVDSKLHEISRGAPHNVSSLIGCFFFP